MKDERGLVEVGEILGDYPENEISDLSGVPVEKPPIILSPLQYALGRQCGKSRRFSLEDYKE